MKYRAIRKRTQGGKSELRQGAGISRLLQHSVGVAGVVFFAPPPNLRWASDLNHSLNLYLIPFQFFSSPLDGLLMNVRSLKQKYPFIFDLVSSSKASSLSLSKTWLLAVSSDYWFSLPLLSDYNLFHTLQNSQAGGGVCFSVSVSNHFIFVPFSHLNILLYPSNLTGLPS